MASVSFNQELNLGSCKEGTRADSDHLLLGAARILPALPHHRGGPNLDLTSSRPQGWAGMCLL